MNADVAIQARANDELNEYGQWHSSQGKPLSYINTDDAIQIRALLI